MGTMNVVKRQSLSDEAISRFIDPRTGQRLRPLGVVNGRTVWPMMGASPDDPNNEEDEGTEDKDGSPEGGSSSEDGDKGNPDAKITALEDEKNRHVRRRQEAETERDRLRAELEELKGKDQTELERATSRVTELESENTALNEALRQTRLENAFLTDNTYTWHNPRRALSLADLSDVEIDDDGTVHGLKKALDALAKSDAYLLKKEAEGNEEETPQGTGTSKNKSKRQQTKADADNEALYNKYPALRR